MNTANVRPYSLDEKRQKKPNLTSADISQWKETVLASVRTDNDLKLLLTLEEFGDAKAVNRGFTDNNPADRAGHLNRLLTIIATHAPTSLFNEITKRKKSFNSIWEEINAWADIRTPSSNHLVYYRLKQAYDPSRQTPQELFYNLRDSMESSFAKKDLYFDKKKLEADEDFSPTAEATVILDWLHAIGGNALVEHVFRVYTTELETIHLKDLQRKISENLVSLQANANSDEGKLTAQMGKTFIDPDYRQRDRRDQRGRRDSRDRRNRSSPPSQRRREGLPDASGHTIDRCSGLSQSNRRKIANVHRVSTSGDQATNDFEEETADEYGDDDYEDGESDVGENDDRE